MAARSHRRRSWALASLAASIALLAPACGSDDTTAAPADTAAPDAAATTPAADEPASDATAAPAAPSTPGTDGDAGTPATGTPAAAPIELLSFTAPLVGGGSFDGARYATERPVAFWFWAPT